MNVKCESCTLLHTLYTLLQSKQSCEVGVIILILQRKKLKIREGKWLAKVKQQTRGRVDLNLCLPAHKGHAFLIVLKCPQFIPGAIRMSHHIFREINTVFCAYYFYLLLGRNNSNRYNRLIISPKALSGI